MRRTTEEYVGIVEKVHSNFYDYSLVDYVTAHIKVKIICPHHGVFEQSANKHLRGQRCPKCMGKNRTTKEFIDEVSVTHKGKYDYKNTIYVRCDSPVKIICPDHGEFNQTPNSHMIGAGCPKCSPSFPLTTETFTQKAQNKHKNKFDYSLVNYTASKSKVKIICYEHGVFTSTPSAHLMGTGCPKCVGLYRTTDEFIELSSDIHRNKFDYSLVNYIDTKTKVKIICPEHGVFEQLPTNHLLNMGCKKCGNEKMSEFHATPPEVYAERCKIIHGNKYDYSLVKYNRGYTKIKIICPEHGVFEQSANLHILGRGCSKCGGCYQPTTNEVILDFKATHGDFYDYSLVNYIDTKTKVKIICPEHGVFEQSPANHKKGTNCAACTGRKKLTWEEILPQFKEAHGDKFDYSLVNYIDTKTKVKIICPEHGVFEQSPEIHKNGSGCVHCAGIYPLTTEAAILGFRNTHGNFYDYSLVDYVSSHVKVKIICPDHGEFTQTPAHHKNGNGCPKHHQSKNEVIISEWLTNNNIKFISEYRNSTCRDKNPLPFDFFLPVLNILIEYDGEGHYIPICRTSRDTPKITERRLKNIQRRDKIKTEWAKNNGKFLLRIPYFDDIIESLNEILKNNS